MKFVIIDSPYVRRGRRGVETRRNPPLGLVQSHRSAGQAGIPGLVP